MVKVSELTEATTLGETDEFYVNDSGVPKRITTANLRSVISGGASLSLPTGWFVADSTYGIVGDGLTDDTAGFQAWMDAMGVFANTASAAGLKPGVVGIIPPGVYFTTGTIEIPEIDSGGTKLVLAHGAVIRAGGAVPVFATTIPASNGDADAHVSLYSQWRWQGLNIDGSRIAGSKAFHVYAAGRWTVDGCVFQDLDRAFDCEFLLGSEFVNCQFSNSNLSLLRIENGTWTGATPGNSASNMTRVNHCRFYNRGAAEVGLFVDQTGGISVRDCTFEGGNPVDNVYLSPSGNNSALYVEVVNCWFENNPTNSHVKLEVVHKASVGFAYVTGNDNGVLIDGIGSTGGVIEVTQFPYGASATYGANVLPKFTTDVANETKWVFRNTVGNGTKMLDPSLWTDARVPNYLLHDGFNAAQGDRLLETSNTRSVTGSRSGNAALADLLVELARMGLVSDDTTA